MTDLKLLNIARQYFKDNAKGGTLSPLKLKRYQQLLEQAMRKPQLPADKLADEIMKERQRGKSYAEIVKLNGNELFTEECEVDAYSTSDHYSYGNTGMGMMRYNPGRGGIDKKLLTNRYI